MNHVRLYLLATLLTAGCLHDKEEAGDPIVGSAIDDIAYRVQKDIYVVFGDADLHAGEVSGDHFYYRSASLPTDLQIKRIFGEESETIEVHPIQSWHNTGQFPVQFSSDSTFTIDVTGPSLLPKRLLTGSFTEKHDPSAEEEGCYEFRFTLFFQDLMGVKKSYSGVPLKNLCYTGIGKSLAD